MKKNKLFNDKLPWIALAIVSLTSMLSTIFLTSAFSSEINDYINPPHHVRVLEKTGRAWVEIDFSSKRKRLFESEMGLQSYSLATVLSEIAKTANFSVQIDQGKITELAGVSAAAVRAGSWNIYRYDTRVHQPVDLLTVAANDYYHIRFER